MKNIFLLLSFLALSLSGYAQNTFGGIALRVNDTTTYQTNAATLHSLGYYDIYFNNEATNDHWDIWNGSSYDHIFSFSGGGGSVSDWGDIGGTLSDQTDLQAALDAKQALDSDLTAIAGLSPSNDDIIQRKAGAWTNRTLAQYRTDLALVAASITNGVTTSAPDQDQVFDALALKAPLASPTFTTPTLGVASATGRAYDATTWNGSARVPTEDDIRDKIETILTATDYFIVEVTDENNPFAAGTDKRTFRMPAGKTLTAIRASLKTAQSSGTVVTVDVHETGTTILSTKLTIDNTETTSTTAATAAVISDSSLADDAVITIDVDAIGSGTAVGLKLIFYWN